MYFRLVFSSKVWGTWETGDSRRRRPDRVIPISKIILTSTSIDFTCTQDVFVHCAYNCGRTYRTQRYGLNKKEWHKTLRKLNAHESQRCPHRHGLPSQNSSSGSSVCTEATSPSATLPWLTQHMEPGSNMSRKGGSSIAQDRASVSDDRRKRAPVTAQKRTAAKALGDDRGPSYYRLREAQARLRALEKSMSALRHSTQMSKAQYRAEYLSVVDENKKLEDTIKMLVGRAALLMKRMQLGQGLPPRDIWERRFKLTDEHPDDFVKVMYSIEKVRAAKDAELQRLIQEKSSHVMRQRRASARNRSLRLADFVPRQ